MSLVNEKVAVQSLEGRYVVKLLLKLFRSSPKDRIAIVLHNVIENLSPALIASRVDCLSFGPFCGMYNDFAAATSSGYVLIHANLGGKLWPLDDAHQEAFEYALKAIRSFGRQAEQCCDVFAERKKLSLHKRVYALGFLGLLAGNNLCLRRGRKTNVAVSSFGFAASHLNAGEAYERLYKGCIDASCYSYRQFNILAPHFEQSFFRNGFPQFARQPYFCHRSDLD